MGAFTLDDRYLREEGEVYLTGVQALVRLRARPRRGTTGAAACDRGVRLRLRGFAARRATTWSSPGSRRAARRARRRPPAGPQRGARRDRGRGQPAGRRGSARCGRTGSPASGTARPPGWTGRPTRCGTPTWSAPHPRGGAVALVGDDPAAKSSTRAVRVGGGPRRPGDADALPGRPGRRSSTSACTRSSCPGPAACGRR